MTKAAMITTVIVLSASTASAATVSPTSASHDQAVPAAATQPAPQLRQEIRDQLAKAGLTDIKIAPEEYVVHAKNKDGNPVVMVVTPNSFLELADVKVTNSNNSQPKRSPVEPDPTPLSKQH
jgi:hypothetical protein